MIIENIKETNKYNTPFGACARVCVCEEDPRIGDNKI